MARALVSGARALVCGARALVSVARALVAGPRRAQSAGTRRAGASSTRTYGETTSPQSTAPTRTPNRDRGLNTLAFTRMTDKGERPLPRYTRSALPQALPSPPSWHTRTRAPVGETGSPGRSEPGRLTTATRVSASECCRRSSTSASSSAPAGLQRHTTAGLPRLRAAETITLTIFGRAAQLSRSEPEDHLPQRSPATAEPMSTAKPRGGTSGSAGEPQPEIPHSITFGSAGLSSRSGRRRHDQGLQELPDAR